VKQYSKQLRSAHTPVPNCLYILTTVTFTDEASLNSARRPYSDYPPKYLSLLLLS